MIQKANGAAIRVIRDRTGITLTDLAACVGIDKSQLSRIERGESETTPAVMRALADRLRVPLEAITYPAAPPEPLAATP